MKKLSKRMIISVLTLVLTLAALGTTTFAWFSLSTTSRVSQISGNVTGGEGLEIRLFHSNATGEHTPWLANIDEDTVSAFIGKIFGTNKFDAVSTDDGTSYTKMEQDQTTGHLTLDTVAVANQDYLQFEIQFRSQSEGDVSLSNLTFSGDGDTFMPDGYAYFQHLNSGTKTTDNVETRAAYGARVSFEHIATPSTFDVYQMDSGDANNVLPGSSPQKHGQFSYLTDGRGLVLSKGDNVITESDLNSIDILEADINTDLDTKVELAEDTGPAGAGYWSAKLIVRIWIEGWDPDSYDSIYTMPLVVDLTFKKDVVASTTP